MTKARTINNKTPTKTELLISNYEFKEHLELRLKIGEEMLNRQINTNEELELLIKNSNSWSDYNAEYLKQSFNNSFNEYRKDYQSSGTYWGGIAGPSLQQPERQKFIIKNQITNLKNLIEKSVLFKSPTEETNQAKVLSINTNEIFIVHGHDEEAKSKTARFIEQLGFRPIILHEQASSGKTIIEKIEEYTNVGFGIILYTPCDLGGKTIDTLKSRARQNVVFEHGYLIGKIGRKNVCALVKGDIETPNDISGVVYVKMDSDEAWHLKIAKELKSSGYKVDMNKL